MAAALLPMLAVWAEAEWMHLVFVAVAAPLTLVAFGTRASDDVGSGLLAGLAATGFLLLGIGAFGPEAASTPTTVAGSLCLAAAHLCNWRARSAADRCGEA